MDKWIEIIPNWLTAIGTIGATVLALFQRSIRNWWNRPKIKISYQHKEPFYIIPESNQSSDDSKQIQINVQIINNGKFNATYSALYVDCYYEKKENDTKFCSKAFMPLQLKDTHNTTTIIPHLSYYFPVAKVQKQDKFVSEADKGSERQFYKLSIGEGKNAILLGKGTFIVPLKFYASNVHEISYLQITSVH